jgi:hypothetical protein
MEEPLFTSLLGGSCAGLLPGLESIGNAGPLNGFIDGESGPTLDLGLFPCEVGIIDSLRIQEPREEIESRLGSSSKYSRDDSSSCLSIENLLPLLLLLCMSTLAVEVCLRSVGVGFGGEEPVGGRAGLDSGVIIVELVPGRVFDADEPGL